MNATQRRSHLPRARMAALIGLVAVLGAGGWWLYRWLTAEDSTPGIIVASGRVEGRQVRISSGADGRVLDMGVQEGDPVVAGQLIAVIDRRVEHAALLGARAKARAAEAHARAADRTSAALVRELAFARTEARRYGELYERDAGPRQAAERAEATVRRIEEELRTAREAHAVALEQVAAARAEVEAIDVRHGESEVVAPVPGVVQHELVRTGEMVAAGTPLVALVRLEDVKLRVYVPLIDAERIRPGAQARVYLDAFPDRFFPATVERVASQAEFTPKDVHTPDERTTLVFAVDVRIPNPDGHLKDGIPADIYIRWDPSSAWPERRPWE